VVVRPEKIALVPAAAVNAGATPIAVLLHLDR